jgi:hypothetical protein
MVQVVLRRRSDCTQSADDALSFIGSLAGVTLVNHSGGNLLVDAEDKHLEPLKAGLPGWIVAPQGARIPVPDTRRTLR